MTKALIDRLKIGCFGLDPIDPLRLLLDEVIEALAQPEQEPVREEKYIYGTPLLDAMTKDYVPPQRTWVDLTDEERNTITRHHAYVDNIIRATEAKLRSKNG